MANKYNLLKVLHTRLKPAETRLHVVVNQIGVILL